ncbi:MAG: hypothetical protein COV45_09210 [Deltaproteobacteria bacterium CG11_big_fil_rev_8_21_14_0_20_47_16]|nr:MAG: hypothetical protein COV45_09210 [Deltaproteobacteria bacterium CG11_big_fil_rev_8_21_14_0_20_47_16]
MPTGAAKVTFTERDLSFFIQAVTQGRNCVQITARRGPVNEVKLVGSMKQFQENYGLPIDSSDSDIVVQRAFDRGAVLYINRVVHYTDPADASTIAALKASLTLQDQQSRNTLTIEAANQGTWGNTLVVTITANDVDPDRFDLRIDYPEQSELSESYRYLTMNQDDTEYYAVKVINDQSKLVKLIDLEAGDPFESDSVTVGIDTFDSGDDFTINIDDIPLMASSLKDSINATSGDVTATSLSNVISLTAVVAGVAGNAIALSAVTGGGNISVSGANLAGGLDAVAAGGTITFGIPADGDTVTVDGSLFTKVPGPPGANEFSNIGELTALIEALANVNATDDGLIITVTAANPGTAGNSITMVSASGAGLTLSGATLLGGSDAIAATGTVTFSPDPVTVDNPTPVTATNLAGGADGLSGLDDDDWIGNPATRTGLYAFDDIDDAFGLACPENTSPAVVAAGVAYCENREDMVYYAEPPASVDSAEEAIDFRLGQGLWVHAAFNSSYGAMYFGRPKIRSAKTNDITDISLIGDVFGVHAYNDAKAEVWFAPAGLQRGRIPNTLGVHYNVGTPGRSSEMDDLVNNQISPIVDFSDEGTVIWGEQTLQRAPSALQSLHIRRLLIYMRKALLKINRIYLFEPNDPITWRRVFNLINPWMEDLLKRRAFYEYLIQCDQDAKSINDAILNTPERIDRGEFVCRLFIKPTRTLKYFGIEAVITKSNANFKELLDIRL